MLKIGKLFLHTFQSIVHLLGQNILLIGGEGAVCKLLSRIGPNRYIYDNNIKMNISEQKFWQPNIIISLQY